MNTLNKLSNAMPQQTKQVEQKDMDFLKRYINQEIIVRSIHPSGATDAYKCRLLEVKDFSHITVERKGVMPFIPSKEDDSIIFEIRAIQGTETNPVYENITIKNMISKMAYGELKRTLSLGLDALRRLSYGSEVADKLKTEQAAAQSLRH